MEGYLGGQMFACAHSVGTSQMLAKLVFVALLTLLAATEACGRDNRVTATVQCAFATGRPATFGAGRDRCWDPVNGRTMVPKSSVACAIERDDGSLGSVEFVFSEAETSACIKGAPATANQYNAALAYLGPKERALFLSQVAAH